ncbi:MAG: hypothetical protein GSR77_04890 [Desulfurococcales archaeon]|nr:hypothetical protein [Desulfurococcales archaeon]
MALKKRWLILALLVIGLLASLQAVPRQLVLKFTIPGNASFIENDGPYGTSLLAEYLQEKGLEIVTVPSIDAIDDLDLGNYQDIIYLVISPVNFTSEYAMKNVYTKLTDLTVSKRVHLVIFDEYPTKGEILLAENFEKDICGERYFVISDEVTPINEYATAIFYNGIRLPTGYTSFISSPDFKDRPLVSTPGVVDFTKLSILTYPVNPLGLVWPGPEGGTNWNLMAASCKGYKGGVVLVADSTIAINMAAENNTEYLEVSYDLITATLPYMNNNTLVIIDEYIYSSNPQSLVVKLHPSFLLIYLVQVYDRIEGYALDRLSQANLAGLIAALLGLLILLASWLSTSYASRLKRREDTLLKSIAGKKEGKKRRLASMPGFIGSYHELQYVCERARKELKAMRIEDLMRAQDNSDLRRLMESLYREVEGSCRGGVNPVLAFLPVWGGRIRRIRESVELLASLLRVRPAETVK